MGKVIDINSRIWKMKGNKLILISQMENNHLINAIKFMENKGIYNKKYLKLIEELIRRFENNGKIKLKAEEYIRYKKMVKKYA